MHVTRQIGRYEIDREIGRGGTAIVYIARQVDLGREVALKELSAFHAGDRLFAERFLREARLGGSLNHPNIVTVYDYFEHDAVPYIAMEYVARGSLRAYDAPLSMAQSLGVLEGMLAGLSHAEARSIVHRDLKPENLMVADDGTIKIADFGIAKALSGSVSINLTETGTTVGTPHYMAPEQAMGEPIGPATDLYATGAIAYELFTGRPPFGSAATPMAVLLRHVSERAEPPIAHDPALDPRISEWIMRMLAKGPEHRPASAEVAWEELEDIALDLLGLPPRLPEGLRKRDALEDEGDAKHDVGPRVGDVLFARGAQLRDAVPDRHHRASGEQPERSHQRPHVGLTSVAQRVRLVRRPAPAFVADEEQDLVAGVGPRVRRLGQHRCGSRDHRDDGLAKRDGDVGEERDDHGGR